MEGLAVSFEIHDRIASRTFDLALPVLGAAAVLLLPVYIFGVPEQPSRLTSMVVLGLAVLIAFAVRKRIGKPRALVILVVGTAAAIVAGMVVNGGVRAPAYFASMCIVVLVAASYGKRPLACTVVGTVAVGGLLYAAESLGWIARPQTVPAVAMWGTVSVLALATAGLVYIPVSMLQDALERCERQSDELVKAKERLLEAEKLESLGRLAGGVAHDFNNMLSGILGSADELRRELAGQPADRHHELVEIIRGSAARGAELTRSLLLYARKAPLELKPLDMNAVARGAGALLSASLDKRITLDVQTEPGRATVLGSWGHLEHAVINLGVNARDAVSGAGRVTISTRRIELAGDERNLLPGPLPAGKYVGLSVQDSGAGIDPAVRARIFEPFFTTKEVGRGTGLGLAGVFGTVNAHGGAVRVESERGAGACFTLLLPFRPDLEPETAAERPSRTKGTGRVLFVDDEELLRTLASKILTNAGYTVDTAAHGAEALERIKTVPGAYDLVMVDMTMPVMGGRDFCAELRKLDGDVPIAAMTGNPDPETTEALGRLGVHRILEKPYAADALTAVASETRRPARTP